MTIQPGAAVIGVEKEQKTTVNHLVVLLLSGLSKLCYFVLLANAPDVRGP